MRGTNGRRRLVWVGVAVSLLVLFVVALLTSGLTPLARNRADDPSILALRAIIALMQLVTGVWLFAVGASFGSFVNVVVYRLPRGESIVRRASHCPKCDADIRMRDNVPILGWLLLGGKCRSCGLPISKRYPLVESLAAVMFTSLAYVELLSGGANLPHVKPHGAAGITWTLVDVMNLDNAILWIYVYHVFLLGVLLTAGLIKYDGNSVPLKLLAIAFLVAVLGPLLSPLSGPTMHPIGWSSFYPAARLALRSPWNDMLFGLVIGGGLGLLVTAIVPRRAIGWRAISRRPELGPMTALVGVCLGWQAAVACTVVAVVLKAVESIVASLTSDLLRLSLILYLMLAAYLQICLWRYMPQWSWWPGAGASWWVLPIAAVICWLSVTLIGWTPPRESVPATAKLSVSE